MPGKDGSLIRRLIGAVFVTAAFGGFGMLLTSAHKREEQALRQLLRILSEMESELLCRATPLPVLFASVGEGDLKAVFQDMAAEMRKCSLPDAESCMEAALAKHPCLPSKTSSVLTLLGRSVGRFDLNGQLQELAGVKAECRRMLEKHCENQDSRLRSYLALSLCSGTVIAIILL